MAARRLPRQSLRTVQGTPATPPASGANDIAVSAPAGDDRLLMAATFAVLALVLVRCVVGVAGNVYWDVDPASPQGRIPTLWLGPAGAVWLNSLSWLAAAFALAVHVRQGGHLDVMSLLLAAGGAAAVAWHLPEHADDLFHGPAWLAAVALALAALHLAAHRRPRRFMVAGLLAILAPLVIDAATYVWADHAETVANFARDEAAALRARGWAEGSSHALLFERRLGFAEAAGSFFMSNVFGTVVAALAAAATCLALGAAIARRWRHAVAPAVAALAGLLAVWLSASRGALAVLLATVVLVLLAAGLRRWRGLRWSLPLAALLLIVLIIAAVVGRGAMGPPDSPDDPTLSILFRAQYWQAAARMLEAVPWPERLTGVGVGGFSTAYLWAKQPLNPEEVASAHGVLVDYVTMLGVGGVAWCLLLVWWCWRSGTVAARGLAGMGPGNEPPETGPGAGADASPLAVERGDLGWVVLLTVAVFGGQVAIDWPTLLDPVRFLLWAGGIAAFVLLAAVILGDRRGGHGGWLALGTFGAAVVVLGHGQLDMAFFQPGASVLAWALVALAGGGATAAERPAAAGEGPGLRRWLRPGMIVPAAMVVGVGLLVPVYHLPVLRQQALLAQAAEAYRDGDPQPDRLERAIAVLPVDPAPYRWMASMRARAMALLARQGRHAEALKQLDRALLVLDRAQTSGLSRPALLRYRAQLYELAAAAFDQPGRLDQAINVWYAVIDRSPHSMQDHLHLADLLWRLGRREEAARLYRRGLELHEQAYLDPLRQLPDARRRAVEQRLRQATGDNG